MSQLQATILRIETAEACKRRSYRCSVYVKHKSNDTYRAIYFGTTPNNIPADAELYIENNKLIVRKHTIQNSSSPSRKIVGGRRSPAVACWASDHWVASSNPLRGKFRY